MLDAIFISVLWKFLIEPDWQKPLAMWINEEKHKIDNYKQNALTWSNFDIIKGIM